MAYDESFDPSLYHSDIYHHTRQVIHNWLHILPQKPIGISTFNEGVTTAPREYSQKQLEEDIKGYCKLELRQLHLTGKPFSTASILCDNENGHEVLSRFWEQNDTPILPAPSIETFNAYTKACFYLYLRWLFYHGIYDRPCSVLTCEDVDRLLTCGAIDISFVDFPMGRAMAVHGALLRYHKLERNPRRWTVPSNSPICPTEVEFAQFVTFMEDTRFLNSHLLFGFHFEAYRRPEVPEDFDEKWTEAQGLFGVRKSNKIEDGEGFKLITRITDDTFLAPNETEIPSVMNNPKPERNIAGLPPLFPRIVQQNVSDTFIVVGREVLFKTDLLKIEDIDSEYYDRRAMDRDEGPMDRMYQDYISMDEILSSDEDSDHWIDDAIDSDEC